MTVLLKILVFDFLQELSEGGPHTNLFKRRAPRRDVALIKSIDIIRLGKTPSAGLHLFVAAEPTKAPMCALKLGDRTFLAGVPRGWSGGDKASAQF
jgi:hypothetical protein